MFEESLNKASSSSLGNYSEREDNVGLREHEDYDDDRDDTRESDYEEEEEEDDDALDCDWTTSMNTKKRRKRRCSPLDQVQEKGVYFSSTIKLFMYVNGKQLMFLGVALCCTYADLFLLYIIENHLFTAVEEGLNADLDSSVIVGSLFRNSNGNPSLFFHTLAYHPS